jgi:hypothetical protein
VLLIYRGRKEEEEAGETEEAVPRIAYSSSSHSPGASCRACAADDRGNCSDSGSTRNSRSKTWAFIYELNIIRNVLSKPAHTKEELE